MKRYAAWFAAGLVGLAIGASVTGSFYRRAIRTAIPTLQSMEDAQRYRCMLSMAVLDRLETNQPDRARLLPVREVASYYHHTLGAPESPDRKKVLEQIESFRGKCSVLNEELGRSPP